MLAPNNQYLNLMTLDEIPIIINRVVNTLVDKYTKKDYKLVASHSMNEIDPETKIGSAFINLSNSKRIINKNWVEKTQRAYMTYYESSVIPEIQYVQSADEFGMVEFYELVDKLAEKTLTNKNFVGGTFEVAKKYVIDRLNNSYPIFAELRYMDPSIPDIVLSGLSITADNNTTIEQPKHIKPKIHRKFRELLEKDVENKPKVVRAAVLMENCGLRTSESAASNQNLYEEIGSHILVWVLVQVYDGKIVKILKTENAYRYVIADDWGTMMIKKCNKIIDIENVSEEPPVLPDEVREYVKEKLIEAGLSKEEINQFSSELQKSQSSGKNRDVDITAYILRRNRASVWKNYCGYSQKELDFVLGHAPTSKKYRKEDMNKSEIREMISNKNSRFDLNPKVSLSPKYRPIDISKCRSSNLIPYSGYRFTNKGNEPIRIVIRAVTAECGESITLIHSNKRESTFISNKAIVENPNNRQHTEIIGNVEEELGKEDYE